MSGNPPVDVQAFGQSIWYDNIQRSMINNGELQRLLDEDGVLGVTSNPTNFQKAIGGSADYDAAIETMLALEPYAIYERLAVEDIQRALDILRPIYDRTDGRDGLVSLEVSPLIAHDTDSTVAEAKRLAAVVDRPNVMIKIPATQEGIPAIEATIAAGINVNVTLIFGVKNYEQVMEAYIRGLEQRLAAGEPVSGIASVASFFLSRIDSKVDAMLDNNIRAAQGRDLSRVALNNKLKGKTAIANAKIAYRRFRAIFDGERFAALREAGAQVQRVLWASTSTKNPAYPDTMYIDSLIGADTVNTVPPSTLKKFKDHGNAAETITQGVGEAEQTLDMLAEVSIDLETVTTELQVDGVEAFSDSFTKLLAQVDAKRNVLQTGVIKQQEVAIGVHRQAVHANIANLDKQNFNNRLWAREGTLWKDTFTVANQIQERLGWLDVDETIDRARLLALQEAVRDGDFAHVVLLGMGGSSLAPDVLSRSFGPQPGFPALRMLDSTDPAAIRQVEAAVDLSKTLFVVASKSGGTLETASFFEYFYARTGGNGAQFIAITDARSQLAQTAESRGFRDVFINPSDIGGRFSALSYFGLVPAALMGLDLGRLWASAERMMKACGPEIAGQDHPGIWLGAVLGTLGLDKRDKVTIFCSPVIETFGGWLEQLVAESTGKDGSGLLPIIGATVGKPHDYSTDRLMVFLRVADDDNATLDAGFLALQQAGQPCITLHLGDVYALGGEFFRWEYATAVAGKLLDINPFDEPNVSESKQNTQRLLDHYTAHGAFPASAPLIRDNGVSLHANDHMARLLGDLCTQHHYDHDTLTGMIAAQLNATHAGDYFAVLAYLPPTDAIHGTLEQIRRRLRHVTRRAVTIGYGPRYLHSTGQLHKGGPNNGIFIQLTMDDADDLDIPEAGYSFGALKAAQAVGDLQALQTKGRRVFRLHLSSDPVAGLHKLLGAIELAGERRN
ncbi:MAG: bifunctional transaldolase/phosoglucose isomerase [Chloroflexi bacterium]|nr:bifunctional transaldolase/phosoglucose isomerase [Chloroflexota bacterium]